ncbi:MAG: carboxypeptidase-like regulatory domain-containing protein [Saprospiraceae bacterium]|nr:carboxypeptidase-like regulatory domain-containing protein [Saprospiraceae bacterium]
MNLNAQVSGTIVNQNNDPLQGASILLKGTSKGATSNKEGKFSINSTPDTFQLVISYVGSKTKLVTAKKNARLRITLMEEVIEMPEVVIKSGENPAIPIIRKTIERRKELEDIPDHFQAKAYTKGLITAKNSYSKLLSLGAIDSTEIRDSSGNIIIYLAESLTQYTKIGPDKKEKILSSRRSGDPKGIALNFIQVFNIDFSSNYITFQNKIINPIGNAAFQYYNYELEGSYYEDNQKIYKIKILPKRPDEPVLFGNIYIADDFFTLKQVDLYTRGANIGLELIDTLTIKQSFIPIQHFEKWMPLSQLIAFKAGFFGLKFEGSFLGMYQDYEMLDKDSKIDKKDVIIAFDKLAAKQTDAYWEALRPIKLTDAEAADYHQRDSMAIAHQSPEYLDSMDHIANKFKFTNILTRYTYRNSVSQYSLSAGNLLMGLRFDAVQGFSIRPDITFQKKWKAGPYHLSATARPIYGFSEKKLRYEGVLAWWRTGIRPFRIQLNAGNTADNYNTLEPISPLLNEITSLFFKRNHILFYDNTYLSLSGQYTVVPGLSIEAKVKGQHREGLLNHTNYSFRLKDRDYAFNYPEAWGLEGINSISNAYTTRLALKWQAKNKIIQFPEEAFIMSSNMPVVEIAATKAWQLKSTDADYNRLELNITDIHLPLGFLGVISSNIHTGLFLGKRPKYKVDYAHFPGNLVYVKSTNSYIDTYKRFSYYKYSTDDKYLTFFAEWNLKGFLFKKIPLLNKTGFEEVIACNTMITPEYGLRVELSAGIDRLGFSSFRMMRLDYLWIFENGKYLTHNFVIGLNINALTSLASSIR